MLSSSVGSSPGNLHQYPVNLRLKIQKQDARSLSLASPEYATSFVS